MPAPEWQRRADGNVPGTGREVTYFTQENGGAHNCGLDTYERTAETK